jgi:GT2 family glycosyltransferase
MKKQAREKMKKTVVLCLPTYVMVPFKYLLGVVNLLLYKQDRYVIRSALTMDRLYIDYNRNIITRDALKLYDPDYLFWMDGDMLLDGDTILQLMRHDKDIVSGLYFKKESYEPVMYHKKGELYAPVLRWNPSNIFKVDAVGFGCCLIKASVFRNLAPPWFVYDVGKNKGEDIYFCEKAREAGYEIWVDPSVRPRHLGVSEVGIEHFRAKFGREDSPL